MLQKSEAALGAVEYDGLAQRALAVLDANWRGASTVPSPALYPHQWSWDSACIAIGYSHLDPQRGEQELRSLFRGQWRNGLLPHIVFAPGQGYFPGPEFWQTESSPDAPASPRTSGIDLDGQVPEYERIDRKLVDPAERPTDWEYDRYAYLVKLYRDLRYDGASIRESCPFVVYDVLFNSLLVQANRDLAELARHAG